MLKGKEWSARGASWVECDAKEARYVAMAFTW